MVFAPHANHQDPARNHQPTQLWVVFDTVNHVMDIVYVPFFVIYLTNRLDFGIR